MEDAKRKYGGFLVEVFDSDLLGAPQFMGEGRVLFKDLPKPSALKGASKAVKVPLLPRKDKKDKVSGQVLLKIFYLEEEAGAWSPQEGIERGAPKSIGEKMYRQGYRARHPVVIVPGIYASALECWEGTAAELVGNRIWVTISGMGMKPAGLTSVTNKVSSSFSKLLSSKKEEEDRPKNSASTNTWVQHMRLEEDGFSDPPGVRVRPAQGLHAIDYLCYEMEPFGKKPSYVFAYVIQHLQALGYDHTTLIAAPYDWRLPPQKLNERDVYFWDLKAKIELAVRKAGHPAALLGHSMGCKVAHYFLVWAEATLGYEWIEQYVHQFIPAGAPWLGAPKTLRTLISGDKMGLDYFLLDGDMLDLARSLGGQCWLLPLAEQEQALWGDLAPFVRVQFGKSFKELTLREALKMGGTERSYELFQQHYLDDPLYGKAGADGVCAGLKAPPVPNLRCIYGVNLKTEVQYYFKGAANADAACMKLDAGADKKAKPPAHLKVSGGIVFERPTPQRPSGDGTVPYASLALSKAWEKEVPAGRTVENVELPNSEHREMLSDDAFFRQLFEWVCTSPEQHGICD